MNSSNPKEKNGAHKVEIYIVDAVAFLAYLADKLPKKADDIFRKAEKKEIKLLLPSIALGETLYTIYKGKQIFGEEIPLEKINLIFQVLKNGEIFELVDLNLDAWFIFHGLNIPELHDRMIAATFYYYKASGLITNDPEISESLPMIWK